MLKHLQAVYLSGFQKIWENDQPIINLATGLWKDFLHFGYNLSVAIFCINFCRKLTFKKN